MDLNFDKVFRYVPIKLEQIPGNFLKAETISNQRFFSRMDLTQFLHEVILILRISIFRKFRSQIPLYWWRHNHEINS